MADQPSIFEQNQNPGTNPPTNPPAGTGGTSQPDDLATLLGAIKNEKGEQKYKNVQDALVALQHSQTFIPTLKQTLEEQGAKLQEVSAKAAKVDQLEQLIQQLTQTTQQPAANQPTGVTPEQVADLVNRTLKQTQQEATQAQNLNTVITTMKTVFGDKAPDVFYAKAAELGISREDFNAMAAKNPKAVLKLVGADTANTEQRISPNVNTGGFQPRPDSAIGRNKSKSTLLGASSEDLAVERQAANALVEEMHSMGKTVYDLTDPKTYFKVFK